MYPCNFFRQLKGRNYREFFISVFFCVFFYLCGNSSDTPVPLGVETAELRICFFLFLAATRGEKIQVAGRSSNSWGGAPVRGGELQFVGKRSRSQFNSWGGAPIRGEELQVAVRAPIRGGEPQVAVQFVGRSSNSWGRAPGRSSIRGEELQFVGKSPRSRIYV